MKDPENKFWKRKEHKMSSSKTAHEARGGLGRGESSALNISIKHMYDMQDYIQTTQEQGEFNT